MFLWLSLQREGEEDLHGGEEVGEESRMVANVDVSGMLGLDLFFLYTSFGPISVYSGYFSLLSEPGSEKTILSHVLHKNQVTMLIFTPIGSDSEERWFSQRPAHISSKNFFLSLCGVSGLESCVLSPKLLLQSTKI